jgi:hypothetical protein
MVTEAEAKEIVRQTAKAVLQFSTTIIAPLYWPARDDRGQLISRNGTAFFLQTKEALFGVTAAHVIEGPGGWREYCSTHGNTPLRLGAKTGRSVSFEWDARCVDIDLSIDIATFMVSPREIAQIERTAYTGVQEQWPPEPPKRDQGIFYAGFPAVGTRLLSRIAVEFGAVCGTGLVSAINERDVSVLIDRQHLEPALGEGVVPENFNFGGISGAPLFHVFMTKGGLFMNDLSGVIVAGPNVVGDPDERIEGFDLLAARRSRFIRADGFLDRGLWTSF